MQKKLDKLFILAVTLLALVIIYLLSPILTPFLIGAFLAYLVNPLVNRLVAAHLPRLLSVTLVFLLLFIVLVLLIVLLVPLVGKQVDSFVNAIPAMSAWLQDTVIPWLNDMGVSTEQINIATLKAVLIQNWSKAGGAADVFLRTMLHSSVRVIEWLMNLILVPVVTFYLLCDWNKVVQGIRDLLPRRIEPTVVKLAKECDGVMSAFFRGQLLVMLALSTLYSIGLTLIGLKTGLLIGLISGLLSIVPYLGFVVGIVLASLAAFIQFGSFISVLLVWVVFIIAHIIDNIYLTPKLVGDRIGLHPVVVIFAILAGGSLFGFLGVLLALPVSALIMVLVRHLHHYYHQSELYRK